MEKIKQLMTIMAIIGTVGVTVLFLYYPLRSAMREWKKSEVSLQNTEEAGEEHAAGKERPKQLEEAPEELPKASVSSRDVTLQVQAQGQSCQIDLWRENGNNIGYFFLPSYAAGTDCAISIAEYLTEGHIQISGKPLAKGDVLKDIEWGREYPLEIFDEQDNLTAEASVIFYCTQNLGTVFLETESESMDYIHAYKGNEEGGRATVYDAEGRLLYQGDLEKVSGRGNSTWGLEKKPYEIKLAKSADLFGFGEGKTWNLLANAYDDTQIRNLLILSMGEQLGLDYTPQGAMVSLYCNGEYTGTYYLCEKVKVGEARVNIRDLGEELESVYQMTDLEKLEQKRSEDGTLRWVEMEYNPADISGGYLIERELELRFEEDTVSGFKTAGGDYYAIESPKYASYEQVCYIAGLVQDMEDAAAAEDGINPRTGKHYSEYMDVNSFVRKYLVEEISKNYDGGVTSSFFYKPADSQSTKLFAGPLWDYDAVFGNCGLDEINSNPMGITMLDDHIFGTRLFKSLYQQEDFREAVRDCYREEAGVILESMLNEQIDQLDAVYGQAVFCNNIRWQGMQNRYRYYDTYEDNIRYLKHFIRERKQFLDEVWIDDEIYHRVSFYVDDLIWKRIYVKDGEKPGPLPVPVRNQSIFVRFLNSRNPQIAYDEYRPIFSDMEFYAQWQELPAEETAGLE